MFIIAHWFINQHPQLSTFHANSRDHHIIESWLKYVDVFQQKYSNRGDHMTASLSWTSKGFVSHYLSFPGHHWIRSTPEKSITLDVSVRASYFSQFSWCCCFLDLSFCRGFQQLLREFLIVKWDERTGKWCFLYRMFLCL